MPEDSPEFAEEYYKQALLNSASVPRLSLMLYGRLQALLEEALRCQADPSAMRRSLKQAQQVMSGLLNIFAQSDEPAYQALYLNHEALSLKLSETFKQPQPAEILACLEQIQMYEQSWREQLQIKRRFERAGQPPPLNVRRKQP